jgi:hypothetical protein
MSVSSAVLAVLVSALGACANNQPSNTAATPGSTDTTMGRQEMMGNEAMMKDGGAMYGQQYGQTQYGQQGQYGQGTASNQGTYGQGSTMSQGTMYGGSDTMAMKDGGGQMMGDQSTMGSSSMGGGRATMGGGDTMAMKDAGGTMMGSTTGGSMDMGMGDQCPMLLPGTSVQAKDTKDGMAMTFTTSGDAAELRRRVRMMAEHMNASTMGGGSTTGTMMPAMHCQVEDAGRGARLMITPDDPSRATEMRQHMKAHAQMMNQSHSCVMMMGDAGM